MPRETITVTLELLTPMFMSGADQEVSELRPASVRGMLRFWFRATVGASLPVKELREREARLFGAADEKIGASRFRVITRDKSMIPISKGDSVPSSAYGNAIAYIGYGPYTREEGKNISTRQGYVPGSTFEITLHFLQSPKPQIKKDLTLSLWAWLKLGGIGSRSRRGFGALDIVDGNTLFSEMLGQDFARPIPTSHSWSRILAEAHGNSSAFTCVTQQARLFRGPVHSCWENSLGWLSSQWKKWRNALLVVEHPKGYYRSMVGAPLNINKENVAPVSRRASPFFLHVWRENNGYVPGILFLPALYAVHTGTDSERADWQTRFEEATQKVLEEISNETGVSEIKASG